MSLEDVYYVVIIWLGFSLFVVCFGMGSRVMRKILRFSEGFCVFFFLRGKRRVG